MAKRKHSLLVVILAGIGGWIVGANVGARIAMASPDCDPNRMLPNPRRRRIR